ncbi:MAG TPA: esterase-like activity of phytase family protein [Chthoniobacteraceae bacterium]|jgi:hypothetical protein|nr:esterase-like activity of phytase family protein [Chthoniobacteraceae bacterium]
MRLRRSILAATLASLCLSPALRATPELIAIGSFSLTADLSGLTGTLENGVAGNTFGGLGSGLTWAGGNTFLAVPDRGPNATSWNSNLDDTTSYIARFQTLNLNLSAVPSGNLTYTLTPTLTATTLLSSPTALTYAAANAANNNIAGAPAQNTGSQYYFTGRSDNFAAGSSTTPSNGRLDPEGVRVSPDGRSLFVSDEYGPYVYQFDRATGLRLRAFTLPGNLAVANPAPTTTGETAGNTTGRVANKGMEGLAITPDGTKLVGIMQAPLLQDSGSNIRIVTIDILTGVVKEYAYKLTTGTGVSEIVALNSHEFLVDERDGKGLGDGTTAVNKRLYKIDLDLVTGTHEVDAKSGDLSADAFGGSTPTLVKTEFLNLVSAFGAKGITAPNVPSKIEGLAFGSDVVIGGVNNHTLYVGNDNDFVPGTAGPSNVYVFSFTDADLGGSTFVNQTIAAIPEPGSLALCALGAAGFLGFVRRRRPARSTLARRSGGALSPALAGLALGAATLVPARAGVFISEVMSSEGTGQTYAADWFEVTNSGPGIVTLSGWKVDDDSNNFSLGVALNGVASIDPGQSVVFVEGTSATATAFVNSWFGGTAPVGFSIGSYTGSGVGLGANGDQVNLFDNTGLRVANVSFLVASAGRSWDNGAGINGSITAFSSAGVNGAFAAPVPSTEIGSPGAIPEPTTIVSVLAGVGMLVGLRRRRG